MKTNALSVANYFIELANKEEKAIHLLGLVKRVYIAHGFALALLGHGLLDERFDHVEAWKYGPVIPSVYHSFKQYHTSRITKKTDVMEWNDNLEPTFVKPELTGNDEKTIVEMVWKRYANFSDSDLVSLLHADGTPWRLCYVEGLNCEIPDELTERFYQIVVERVRKRMEMR